MSLRLASVLLAALALPACSRVENGIASVTDGLTSFSGRYGPGWGGMRPTTPDESLTVQRVRAGPRAAPDELLRIEPGDMWPAEDTPRATLANPDEALRGIPNLRQGMADPSTEVRRRGSSTPPDLLRPPQNNANNVVQPSVPMPDAPPRPFRADRPAGVPGGVIDTPSGPLPTTNQSGNISTTLSPQGAGTAIRSGNTTTIFRPDGNIEQVPTPR
ncbi:MAG TPA: hypothetical protein VEY31_07940 [Roseococcus sp.]|nr:hypothetical protein [Roseococcus sp.]